MDMSFFFSFSNNLMIEIHLLWIFGRFQVLHTKSNNLSIQSVKCLEPIRNMGSCFFTKTIIWICIYYFLLKIFAVFMWGLHGVLNLVYSNCFLGLNITIITKKKRLNVEFVSWVCLKNASVQRLSWLFLMVTSISLDPITSKGVLLTYILVILLEFNTLICL
jgi:hypothetical protein